MQSVLEAFDASGAFETCRVKGGRILFLDEHLHRLAESLRTVGIFPWSRATTRSALIRAARWVRDGSVRVAVRRDPSEPLLIHRQRGIPYSERIRAAGASVVTVPSRWPAADTGTAQAKGSERLGGVLARIEGRGAVEVLRLSPRGVLTEGTVSNLFMIQHGVLCTPPAWLGVLEGVTRSRVIRAARRLKVPVQETPFSRHDLFNAEEAFLTNVLMGILPVREADGRRIGSKIPGPVTRRLMRALERVESRE